MGKILYIINPQENIINTEDKRELMNDLARYIERHKDEYDGFVISIKWHPHNHSSFKNGISPYCVKYSFGSSIYHPIYKMIVKSEKPFIILEHRTMKDDNSQCAINDHSCNNMRLVNFITSFGDNETLWLCGIDDVGNNDEVAQTVVELRKRNIGDEVVCFEEFINY